MPSQESKHKRRIQFKFDDSEYKKSLHYPNQFVDTVHGKGWVGIDADNKVHVDPQYLKRITQLLRLRSIEGDKPYNELTSKHLKDFTLLSNCHRAMLFTFGLEISRLEGNEFGSMIVNNYFRKTAPLQDTSETILESEIHRQPQSAFPMCLNFYTDTTYRKMDAVHSVVVLGISDNGKIICFHKNEIGDGKKVEITTLDKIEEVNSLGYKYTLHTQDEVEGILDEFRQTNYYERE